jgi:hypothetical protein
MLEHSVRLPAAGRNAFPRAQAREAKRDQDQDVDVACFALQEQGNNRRYQVGGDCGMRRIVEAKQRDMCSWYVLKSRPLDRTLDTW